MSSSNSSATTRSSEFVQSFPIGTAGVIGLCCSAHVSQIVLDVNVRHFTMAPRLVLHLHQCYRIVTSCFVHGSLMHISMNMLSTATIGALLERRFGTLSHLVIILWSIVLTGIFYLSLAVAAQKLAGSDDLLNSHALGFSGIMFHLLVLESNLTPNATRSIFGFINVPSYAYPVAMLVVMQVIMPNISFTGHLCGIVAGMLHLYGFLDCIMLKESTLQEMEQWNMLRFLMTKDNFVPTPSASSANSESRTRRDPGAFLVHMRRGCKRARTLCGSLVETIQVTIFGRGRRANSNIYLGNLINPHDDSGEDDGLILGDDLTDRQVSQLV